MSLTLINTIDGTTELMPAYDPLVYVYNSTNKNELGFRYLFQVFKSGTSTKIYEERVAPRPGDGYGVIDLSEPISNLLSYDINFLSMANSTSVMPNSAYAYDMQIREEYIVNFTFEDLNFPGTTIWDINALSNPFVIGDQIEVELDDPTLFPAMQGLFTVVDSGVSGGIFYVRVNVPFQSTPSGTGGKIKFADNRKYISPTYSVVQEVCAFNGGTDPISYNSYNESIWYGLPGISAPFRRMMTTLPDNYYLPLNSDIRVQWKNQVTNATRIIFENNTGDKFYVNMPSFTDGLGVSSMGAGPNNLPTMTTISGTSPLIKPATLWYDFYYANSLNATSGKKYRIYLDRTCKKEDIVILFQDRLGSFLSFPFGASFRKKGDIERTTANIFNQQLSTVFPTKWISNYQKNGMSNINIMLTTTYELMTDPLNYDMQVLFEELITSPYTFIKMGGVYYKCLITEKNFTTESRKYNKIVQKTVEVSIVEDFLNN